MTISDVLTYVKARMNESSALTPNWSDSELYQIVENKCNEVLSTIGLIDATSSFSTIAGTDSYSYPTDFLILRRVWCDGIGIKYINHRQYESRQPSGVKPRGRPREMLLFADTIYFTPTPDAIYTVEVWGEKKQSAITSPSSTIDLPSVFHPAICDGVIMEMFAKDLNSGFYDRYNEKWEKIHMPSMREFAKRRRKRGMPTTVIDSDSVLETEFGVI